MAVLPCPSIDWYLVHERIKFKQGDMFFDSVLAFFYAYIGYVAIAKGTTIYDKVEGRFRDGIVKQVEFNLGSFLLDTYRGNAINEIVLGLDNTVSTLPNMGTGKEVEIRKFENYWSQIMFGHSYESALPAIEGKFGTKDRRKLQWPSTLQFAYHIRNGCFHGNTFDIQNNTMSKKIPTSWRGQNITYADSGKQVLGKFMSSGDVLILLYDMQVLLV
jgi:hypothetical protein